MSITFKNWIQYLRSPGRNSSQSLNTNKEEKIPKTLKIVFKKLIHPKAG